MREILRPLAAALGIAAMMALPDKDTPNMADDPELRRLMLPVIPVILTVLAFNFLGDGLRDAADPYH